MRKLDSTKACRYHRPDMFKVTEAILTRILADRPILADQIELEVSSRDPARIESLIKEKPPLEALQLVERVNTEACNKYKSMVRTSRRTLDNRDTITILAGALATLFIIIGLILTLLEYSIAAAVFEVLTLMAGATSVFLMINARKLRSTIEHKFIIQTEYCNDSTRLALLSGALTGTDVDETQKIIQRLLFTEDL